MEASALPASVGLRRTRIAIGASFLRIRSDEQLVKLFREGNDQAFDVIYDRYRPRLCAYARQMLAGTGQDPEDAVQEIFWRAFDALRANNRKLALRAWLYRIAHNRCVDERRRPRAVLVELNDAPAPSFQDPVASAEQRDAIREVVTDIQRLPDQQRSALLAVEICDMTYADVASALGTSEGAVKSLLVRARLGLTEASMARNTDCSQIRTELIETQQKRGRDSKLARLHMQDCSECRRFRAEMRSVNHSLAALAPTLGPLGVIANLLGFGGGSAAGGSAVAGGGAAGTGAAAGAAGTATSAGLLAGGATHVVTLLAAAVVTAGSAVELHNTLATASHHAHHRAPALVRRAHERAPTALKGGTSAAASASRAGTSSAAVAPTARQTAASREGDAGSPASHAGAGTGANQQPLTMTLDPDNLQFQTTGLSGSTASGSTLGIRDGTASTPSSGTSVDGTSGPSSTGTGGPVTTGTGAVGSGSTDTSSTGTSGTGTSSTGTSSTGASSTGTSSTGTSSPAATTSPSGISSDTTSGTSSGTSNPATAGGTKSTNAPATNISPGSGSSSGSPAATTSSVSGSTSSSAPSKSVAPSATSTNSSNGLPVVVTKHRPRHKVLVGRLL